MKIQVTEEALQWFKEEMEVGAGQTVRLFAKYGGSTDLTHGFSVGVITEDVNNAAVETEEDGIRFVVAEQDEWLFQGQDVKVDFAEKKSSSCRSDVSVCLRLVKYRLTKSSLGNRLRQVGFSKGCHYMSDKEKREHEEKEKLKRDQPDISHKVDSKGDHSDLEETDEDEQA